MAALVTLTQAQAHLRLPVTTDTDTSDPDLVLKRDQAQQIIVGYCATTAYWKDQVLTWTDPTTVPFEVHAAILLQLGELWRFRGDDREGEGPARDHEWGDLSPTIVSLLRRTRDPVVQ